MTIQTISIYHMDTILDGIAFLIYSILFICCWRDDRNNPTVRSFLALLATLMLHAASDILYCVTVYKPPFSKIHYVSTILYFVFGCLNANFMTRYLLSSRALSIKKPKRFLRGVDITGIVFISLCLVLTALRLTFYIVPDGTYVRGSLFMLTMLYPYSLILLNVVLILREKHFFRLKLTFLAQCAFPLLGLLLSNFLHGIATVNISNALAVLIVYTYHYNQKVQLLNEQSIELTNSRAETILSQIQPHFLYNTITAAVGLCQIDPDLAAETMSNFGKYLRNNLEALKRKYPVPFSSEREHIEIYLMLERARFGEQLNIMWDVQTEDFLIPALSVQPLVENAVKHGISSDGTATGTIKISTFEEPRSYYVVVTDNGKGFDPSILSHAEQCIGISNVKARLKMMVNATLTIYSQKGAGTTATICIPKEEGE